MDISKLTRDELIELQGQIKARLKEFKPFRIKKVWRKCGIKTCRCNQEYDPDEFESKDEYNQLVLHGPYLYASWREAGKTKTVSLGREHTQEEISKLGNGLPKWYEFVISQDKFEKLSQDRQWEIYERSLSDDEFKAYYGIDPLDDNVGRPRKLRYDNRAYNTKYDEMKHGNEVKWSKWARLGVGTYKGLTVLEDLEKQNYYFKV